MSNHLYDAFVAAIPGSDRTAIRLADGGQVSYGQLFGLAERLSSHLVRRGVLPGDRVAVQVEKSWQNLALYLACVRAGAVFLPLNTAYPLAELDYFIGDAQPSFIVAQPGTVDGVRELCGKRGQGIVESLGVKGDGTLPAAAADAPILPVSDRGADDLAAILYTSGTTGRSKGAMLTHDNLLSNARVLKDSWHFTSTDVLLHALPIFHTHGLFVACNVLLLAGGAMIFLSRFDADEVMRLLPKATSMMGVPTFYVRLLEHPGLTREATSHIRLLLPGRRRFSPKPIARFPTAPDTRFSNATA
jgi:malonyl-CoA/methylmalonyl-CoA synthetase